MILKCKMCGGDLDIRSGASTAECLYCGSLQTIPNIDNERRANLFDRANHYRRNNDFDKALSIYENLLSEDNDDAEAHWSVVLCKYGIEYVEDPRSGKRIPTVNRTQYASIFNDPDYIAALKNADTAQYQIYQAEAQTIDKIQKGILEISRKEAPFDIFICYKETDENGGRTQDSVIAYDLYTALTKEGYRVFFARVTLEDKLGTAYEPYIFAALNSAKIMLVVGTNAYNMNAVWVKNEWSRYLHLMHDDKTKTLIPVYKDMDPYELPDEFAHLQAQDMGKIGAMQDILRGIGKLLNKNAPEKNSGQSASAVSATVDSLLRRVEQFLDSKQWDSAVEYCNRILDSDPECAMAHFYMFITESKALSYDEMISGDCDPGESASFMSALKYARGEEKEQFETILTEYGKAHKRQKEKRARKKVIIKRIIAVLLIALASAGIFFAVTVIRKNLELKRTYAQAENYFKDHNYDEARKIFKSLGDYSNSEEMMYTCDLRKMDRQETFNNLENISKCKSLVENEYTHDEAVRILTRHGQDFTEKIFNSDSIGSSELFKDMAVECYLTAGFDEDSEEICEVQYQYIQFVLSISASFDHDGLWEFKDLEHLASVNYKDSAQLFEETKAPKATITFGKESYTRDERFAVNVQLYNFLEGWIVGIFPNGEQSKQYFDVSTIYNVGSYGYLDWSWWYNTPSTGSVGNFNVEVYTKDGIFVSSASCQIVK